jgi:hypothetical protein
MESQDVADTQSGIRDIEFVIGANFPAGRSVMLTDYVIANGIHESSKAFWMIDPFLLEDPQDPGKRLLADIFYVFARVEALARLEPNQFAKVREEVLLSAWIAATKAIDITGIEVRELHWHDCSLPLGTTFSELASFPRLLVNALFGRKNGHSFQKKLFARNGGVK